MSATQDVAATSPDLFENGVGTPATGRTEFSLYLWEKIRDRALEPSFCARLSNDDRLREEFLVGARSYGLELVDLDDQSELDRLAAMKPPRDPLQPQQLLIVDALNAIYDEYVIEIVRRAAKTTTIFAWLHGRCLCRAGYQVTFSAQSGVAGSRRLREWGGVLDRVTPPDDLDLPPWLRGKPRPPTQRAQRALALFGDETLIETEAQRHTAAGRGFRIMRGEVGKGIYYDNGSQFLVLKPEASAYRGEAADVSWIDEAQEVDPIEGADLMAGIVPLQDTKEGSAIVLSGTAGEARVGPFWELVDRLRSGDREIGGLDYCASENTDWSIIEDEDRAMDLLREVHPGVGTLTTIEKMRKNWRKLPRPQWAREYLSLWPENFGAAAINAEQWANAALSKKKERPARVAFGLDVRPGGVSSAIVAAWRDARGVAYIEIVEHRSGTLWIPERMQELTKKYRGSTIAYDDISEGKATATEAASLPGTKPRMRVQQYREHAAGCVQLMRDLERGKLRHFDQTGLNAATECASKREVRNDSGIWLWGVVAAGGDISPLVAATRALRNWDQYFAGKNTTARPIMAA